MTGTGAARSEAESVEAERSHSAHHRRGFGDGQGDGVALPLGPCRALWVGTGGDLSIIAADDSSAVTISNVADGTLVPVRAKHVQDATTASDIVALY